MDDAAQAEVIGVNLSRSGRNAWRGRHSGIAVFQAQGGQVIGERAPARSGWSLSRQSGARCGLGHQGSPRAE